MIRPAALAVLVLLSLQVTSIEAQDRSGSPPLINYGKWALAAGALGMNYLAARAHERAEDRFELVEMRCRDNRNLCAVTGAGPYADAETELLYQESLRYDRQARRWLIGGETALVGAAAMFVWELTRRTPKPDNIPFEPEITTLPNGTTRLGVRLSF